MGYSRLIAPRFIARFSGIHPAIIPRNSERHRLVPSPAAPSISTFKSPPLDTEKNITAPARGSRILIRPKTRVLVRVELTRLIGGGLSDNNTDDGGVTYVGRSELKTHKANFLEIIPSLSPQC